MLDAFIRTVEHLRGNPWALPAFMALFAVACQGVPMTLFLVAGGILFGFGGGALCNVLGLILGSTLTFFLSRRWGRALWARWRGQPMPAFFRRPGFWGILVVRLTGFPPLLMANVLAGMSETPYPVFLAASAIGFVPWCAVTSFFAGLLWEALRAGGMAGFKRTLIAHAEPLMILMALFGVLVGASAWFGRRLLPQEGSVKE